MLLKRAMPIQFTKMHGLGNDYFFIEAEHDSPVDWPELSRRMSHRYLGAGSDGIILILPSDKADFAMRIFNADGSEAETCGNGVRCFAKYVHERRLTSKTYFVIDSFEQLFDATRPDFTPLYPQLRALPTLGAGDIAEGDRVIHAGSREGWGDSDDI